MLAGIAAEEERAKRASRPRTRRWRGLAKSDDKLDALGLEQADALARLREAEERLRGAPADDARTLAEWLSGGERGERPAPVLYECERERDAARLIVEAASLRLDEALAERLHYVEKHRAKMLEDARRDVEAARDRLLAHARALPELRTDLLAARETLAWAAAFPEVLPAFGNPSALALGLRAPVKGALGTDAQVGFANVVAALEADAATLAERFGQELERRLGTAPPRSPLREALWDSDPEMVEFKKSERERARQLAEFGNAAQLAREVRE